MSAEGETWQTPVYLMLFPPLSNLSVQKYESATWNKFRLILERQCNSFKWKVFTDIDSSNLFNSVLEIQCNILVSFPYTTDTKGRICICRTSDKILISDWSIEALYLCVPKELILLLFPLAYTKHFFSLYWQFNFRMINTTFSNLLVMTNMKNVNFVAIIWALPYNKVP